MVSSSLKIGNSFGLNDRYEILDILGEGGMGIVLKAYDNILKEYVAIKTLNDKFSNDTSVKNRFLNEAKLCLALTHSNIIRVRDVSIYDDVYYMVMEYIEGVELKSLLKDLDINNLKPIYDMMRPILEALEYAHQYTIHRDIKPANIMISGKKAYLMDFGISKALEDSKLENHTVIGGMGTKKYASPEQTFNANDVDKKTDIYSMGILLYEMFTKHVPKNTAIEDVQKPSIYNNKINAKLDNIILKMIEAKSTLRPDSFQKIINLLDDIFLNDINYDKDISTIATIVQKEDNINSEINEDMVFIEKGNYLRGSGLESKIPIEKPRKSIYIDDFYICKYCVTNIQYNIFIQKTNYKKPKLFDELLSQVPNHPVVYVSYEDALEYCKYNSCSLPSEAQWEKAAKASKNFIYPWGNEFDESKVNIGHSINCTNAVDDYEAGATSNGIYNLSGNIWEWCLDDFVEDFYKNDLLNNPIANTNSELKVVRGGSFDFASVAAKCSFRFNSSKNTYENNIGFRIVKNVN
jgi:serine/threonine protein kinase